MQGEYFNSEKSGREATYRWCSIMWRPGTSLADTNYLGEKGFIYQALQTFCLSINQFDPSAIPFQNNLCKQDMMTT